jgi:branched-chain amino acid transport system permease protein
MSSRATVLLAAGVAVLLAGLPLVADNYLLRLATTVFMYSALALSWNVIGGYAGYPSFATAAFFGLGAYAAGIVQHQGVPMLAAWMFGAAVSTVFAFVLGAAILRLRGHYFAVASLIVAEVLREIINSATGLTGGGMGLNIPVFTQNVDLFTRVFYAAMMVLALAALATTFAVERSKFGFALRCIEQNEDAAVVLGVNTSGYKVLGFALSGCFAGAAGAIYGSWVSYIDPADTFDVLISVKPIIMALFGGAGTVFGPVIGAFLFLAFEETVWRNFMTLHEGLLGLIVIALILFLPKGLLAMRRKAATSLVAFMPRLQVRPAK